MLSSTALIACQQPVNEMKDNDMNALFISDLTAGDGRAAVPGMTVVVHYTGWLYAPDATDNRGTKFDSSLDRGEASRGASPVSLLNHLQPGRTRPFEGTV